MSSFKKHNSRYDKIRHVREKDTTKTSFHFNSVEITKNELIKAIKQLPSNKTSVLSDIPIKAFKNLGQVYSCKLSHCVSVASFPNLLFQLLNLWNPSIQWCHRQAK